IRRQKLLNIFLAIMLATILIQEVVFLLLMTSGHPPAPISSDDPSAFWIGEINTWAAVLFVVIVFIINRYWSERVATYLFVVLLAGSVYANMPDNWLLAALTSGVAISAFLSSFLLRPDASFIIAGLGSVATIVAGILLGTGVYVTPIFNLFSIAAISQLVARDLEQVLHNMRTLNLELDQRVEQRTGELRAILDSTADGIVVFDTDGRAAIANPATERLLGHPPHEIIGRAIDAWVSDNVSTHDQEVIAAILKDRSTHYPSIKVQWDEKTLSMSAAPVKLGSSEEIGTVAVFRDFTREAEVDRMKSTFLSIASHDLRSPLGAILGLTELIREDVYTSPEEQRHAIDRIYANTQYMLSLANSLLGQAQIEAGILQLRLAPLSPSGLVEEVTNAMGVLAQDRGLELTGFVGDDIPQIVTGDREKLSQVLFNLVGNAIKFTEEGSVQVRAFAADEAHWALAVSDTGRGIPEDAQDVIFEPFRQVEGTSAAGVGLGLTIVKQLVDLMEGEIRLESAVGKGSTFTVVLPITAD
ncbi:MAG: PAS domain S-box protein, partial [Anaerolineae bacterium]|nr:PAS domain S-box protein [Anaerolineae bacterium]